MKKITTDELTNIGNNCVAIVNKINAYEDANSGSLTSKDYNKFYEKKLILLGKSIEFYAMATISLVGKLNNELEQISSITLEINNASNKISKLQTYIDVVNSFINVVGKIITKDALSIINSIIKLKTDVKNL